MKSKLDWKNRSEYMKCYRTPQCREERIRTHEGSRLVNKERDKIKQEEVAERLAYKELGITAATWAARKNNWKSAGIKHPPTAQELVALHKQANGYCPICGRRAGKRGLHLHHDHKTGEWKALVCGRCNMGMGQFEDDPELLIQAALWLEGESYVLLKATPDLDTTMRVLRDVIDKIEEAA